jgi:hypothetical protein
MLRGCQAPAAMRPDPHGYALPAPQGLVMAKLTSHRNARVHLARVLGVKEELTFAFLRSNDAAFLSNTACSNAFSAPFPILAIKTSLRDPP